MALKSLSTEDLLQLSSAWVGREDPARKRIEGRPRLSSFLPDLDQAHRGLVAVVPQAESPRLAQITELTTAEDAVHDRLVRGLFGYLTDAALLDDQGADLLAVRDLLFPDGISAVIHATYRGQAGYAARLRERLTPETKALLGRLTIRKDVPLTLADHVEAWLAAADRIGKLQDEAARVAVASSPSQAAQVQSARNGWIRVVNAFLSVAELDALDEESERLVFGPLRAAESTADRRGARRKATDEPVAPVTEA